MVSLESAEKARGKGCTKFLFCGGDVGYQCQPGAGVGFRKELPGCFYCPRRKRRRGGWSTPTVPGTLKDFGDRLNYNLYKWFFQTKHDVLPLVYRNTEYSFAKISLHNWISTDVSPGKNIGVGSHPLLQGIFPDLGIQPGSPILQADSLLSEPPGKPQFPKNINKKQE